jgi:hypothetical protein
VGARLAADAVVLFHFAFVLFVALGGLLALRWPRIGWVHVPCAVWGALVEWTGLVCPLTPLENHFRLAAGLAAYEGGFIARYILPVLYPAGLTRGVQIALGTAVMALNLAVYAALWQRRRGRTSSSRRAGTSL